MFLLENPNSKLKKEELIRKATSTKTCFPLPSPLLLIRFTSLKKHVSTILSWEKSLKTINSGISPYQYLVNALPNGLPDFDGCRAFNMVIDIIMKYIKQMESTSAKVKITHSLYMLNLLKLPEILPAFEKIAIELEILSVKSVDMEVGVADYLQKFVRGATTKIMLFLTKKAYIDPIQDEITGSEPSRVLDTHLGKKK